MAREAAAYPSTAHSHEREVRLRQRELRIKGDGPLQHGGGLLITIVRVASEVRQTSEEEVVGSHALRRLAKRKLEPCVLDPPEQG